MTAVSELVNRLRTYWRRQGTLDLPTPALVVPDGALAPDHYLGLSREGSWSRSQLVRYRSAATFEGARAGRQLVRSFAYQVTQGSGQPERDGRLTFSMLESLRAIGINYETQDLRFRDYQWQNEVFGIEGRGWLVRLNGTDVARMLHLESAANEPLSPGVTSLTYLIGPLSLHSQDGSDVAELLYEARGERYGEALGRGDRERHPGAERNRSAASTGGRSESSVEAAKAEAMLQETLFALDSGQPMRAYEALLSCALAVEALALCGQSVTSWQERLRGMARRTVMMARAVERPQSADGDGPR